MTKEFKGYNGSIILEDKSLVIKRGLRGIFLGGGFFRGDKTIPYSSIIAVQLKKAGLLAGYIQLTLSGGSEAKGGVFQAGYDENSINFYNKNNNNEKFLELKKLIEEKITSSTLKGNNSPLDELEKLARLFEKKIITEEEFLLKKKEILGLS